jgi:hypothetical protein
MKKNGINFVATIIIALIFSQFLPWWSVMIAAFLTALFFSLKRAAVFVVPFLAITIYWIVYSYILSSNNDFILAKKIAVLLPLKGNQYFLLLLSGFIGGLAAGIAAIFGKQCRLIFSK